MSSSMERTLDPLHGAVHLVDKRKKCSPTYKCACNKDTGLFWLKEPQESRPTCLICQAIDNKTK